MLLLYLDFSLQTTQVFFTIKAMHFIQVIAYNREGNINIERCQIVKDLGIIFLILSTNKMYSFIVKDC